MLNYLFLYGDWAPFILRIMLGAAFVAHGYPKLFKAENRQMFSGWLESMGFKSGKFWALVVGVVEFYGGTALILGVYTQLVAALIVVNMLVAMWKVKWGKVGFTAQGGWEIDMVYLVIAISLFLTGAGAWSFDSYFLGLY